MLDLFRTLPTLLNEIEDAAPLREAIVFAAWQRTAGEGLAAHATPVRLKNMTLTIAVSNLTWQCHLKDLAGQMVFKLNAMLGPGTVSFIEFEIDEAAVIKSRGTHAANDDEEMRRLGELEITPEIELAASKIEDEDLKKQFLAAAGNCLVRRTRRVNS